MFLKELSLQNFRNHRELSLDLHELMYISGNNGVGKSSIVEAIHLLLTLKTFRHQSLSEVRTFAEPYVRISAHFEGGNYDDLVFFYQDKRILKAGGQEIVSLSDYTNALPVICYSPGFDTILSKDHSERRNFLDRMVFYTNHSHLNLVKSYNALLLRKRAELDKDNPDSELLNILNTQMAPISKEISQNRNILVHEINNSLLSTEELTTLFMPDMRLSLSINDIDCDDVATEIEKKRPTMGCHKDLLYIRQNGRVLEKFQSFGQRKSALLFLLYHLAKRVEEIRKCDIMLLLDDFEAGLDGERCSALSELFLMHPKGEFKRQIILTGVTNQYINGANEIKLI
ncbi:MAG: AAA family ATPase [Deferribacteraceae bacterium]|jgi:DNA replication and repair protein RecF|nr:AAA family ATPase [Deferribacteraceae bacterium]